MRGFVLAGLNLKYTQVLNRAEALGASADFTPRENVFTDKSVFTRTIQKMCTLPPTSLPRARPRCEVTSSVYTRMIGGLSFHKPGAPLHKERRHLNSSAVLPRTLGKHDK